MSDNIFPKYLLKVNGQRKFLSLVEVGIAYGNVKDNISFGRYVLNRDFSVLPMSEKDKADISAAAEKHSGSK